MRLLQLCKYPAEGPGSEKLRNSIERHRADLQKEYQNFCDCEESRLPHRIPSPCQVSINLLTLKLYDALETHSQFNLSNALPGVSVVEFIKNFIPKYRGEHKEELVKVIELSQ